MNVQHRRLVSLVDYALQSMRTRDPPVQDVGGHGSFALFDRQAQGMAGLQLNHGGSGGDEEIWLSVRAPVAADSAPRPQSPWLDPWLVPESSAHIPPRLAAEIAGAELIAAGTHRNAGLQAADLASVADPAIDPQARVAFADYAFRDEVQAQFSRYLELTWRSWAASQNRAQQDSPLYVDLFTLQQELGGALVDGQLELVWGMGLCRNAGSGAQTVYPLITRAVELGFDPRTRAAEIRPRDVDPVLELEAFLPGNAQARAEAEHGVRQHLAAAGEPISPFDPASYAALLDIAQRALRSDTAGADQLDILPGWVLFARPRSTTLAMQDLERYRSLLASLDDHVPLPGAVAAIVTEVRDDAAKPELPAFRGVTAAYHAGRAAEPVETQDLFFPKPFNDEQARIVQMLEVCDGVVVQGPPGTGKTHTIANIICHWLANGRSVLVTSMRDPALTVLRELLPAEIRPLALSVLATEQDGADRLERSIRGIAAGIQGLDPAAARRQVDGLGEAVDALHGKLKRIDTDLGRWARLNVSRINLEGESLDPQDAAAEVMRHVGQFEWMPDALGVGPQYAPRFSPEDIVRLRDARRQLGEDILYAGIALPEPGDLPDAVLLVRAHDDLQRYARVVRDARASELPVPSGSGAESLIDAKALAGQIARVKAMREEFAALRVPWSDETVARMRSRLPGGLFELLDALSVDMQLAASQRMQLLARAVSVPEAAEADAQFLQAVANLAEGRRAFGLSVFGRPEARKLLQLVRVDGERVTEMADWTLVLAHLELQKSRRALTARWNALAPELGLQAVLSADAKGRLSAESQLADYEKLKQLAHEEAALARMAAALFPAWPRAAMAAQNLAALSELELAIGFHLTKSELGSVSFIVDGLHRAIEGRRGKIFDRMREFVAKLLGNPAVEEAYVVAAWNSLEAELARLRALAGPLSAVAEVTANIESAGAPKLARLLRQTPTGIDEKLSAATFLRDWRLRRLASHLQAIDAHDELKKLSASRDEVERDLARSYVDLVVRRSWLKLAENATPEVQAALQAYLGAMQRIGRGTGKRAHRYRRDARGAAVEAQRAVPCWIMAHHRVSETLPSQLGSFDLVVIDEASQSDLSALPVLLRARKLLVVGDDKQVAPRSAGIDEGRVNELMERHLGGQVPLHAAQMSPDRSIYDLAKVVFAHGSVMLREHFRCVAPIIEYSKREFYDHELHPLRLPAASLRLDPPLLDYLVADARREGNVNRAEAEFIVGEIKSLAGDPRMQSRTVGVVSLLGEEQALHIWKRLTDELSPDVLRRHDVTCGDARQFQGRERDIMFLSMVCAPNDIGAPLAGGIFAQRFNVAASRARDRMVLVRSAEPADLSEADRLRRGLIAHFAQPFAEPPTRVTDMRTLCESRMERELFDWLNGEGYQATPQVSVGAYRIDIVVEGAGDARLAVECDGDKYQGTQQWIEDMRRQRALQRAGWVFWRCFAGAWLRRRRAVLEDLRGTLAAHGIEPIGRGGWGRRRITQTKRVRAG